MFKRLSVCAVILALAILPACGSTNNSTKTSTSSGKSSTSVSSATKSGSASTSTSVATQGATPMPDLTWEQIINLLTPSTVMIRTEVPASAVSNAMLTSGTGIVMSSDGYILTNAHVVDGASALSVYTSGSSKERPARVVGVSPCDDLAVIKVDDTTGLTPATFGKSSTQHVGEDVAAIGYPLNFDIGTDISIARGIVSKLNQTLEPYQSLIQTDAAINHGNSGGPLVNTKGQVIGINTLSFGQTAPGINYAISIDQAQQVIPDLKSGHNRLYLGMNLGPNDYSDYFGTDKGMVVEAVASDSPASVAGVEQAFLLTQLAGLDVNSMADVCKILRSHQDGDVLKVQFLNITASAAQTLAGEITVGKSVSTSKLAVIDSQPLAGATATSSSGTSTGNTGNTKDFSWDFTSNTGDWPVGNGNDLNASIGGGSYNVDTSANTGYVLSPQSVPNSTDATIQADVSVQKGYGGLVVRYSEDSNQKLSYYDCYLNPDGKYGCGVEVHGTWTSLVDPKASSAIKVGQTNTLQLTVIGNTITLTANGTDIDSFTDSQLTTGSIGLEVGDDGSGSGGQATFQKVLAEVIPK